MNLHKAGVQLLQADTKPTSDRQALALLQPCLCSRHALHCSVPPAGQPQRLQKKWLPARCPHLLGSRFAPWMRVAHSCLACARSLHIAAIMVLAAFMQCNSASASPFVCCCPDSSRPPFVMTTQLQFPHEYGRTGLLAAASL